MPAKSKAKPQGWAAKTGRTHVSTAFLPHELEKIAAAAEIEGRSKSQFVVRAAVQAAETILRKNQKSVDSQLTVSR